MKLVNAETIRRLIPALIVGGVLLFSFMAQIPSFASNNDVGYGYANNCGVKGDGMHDHGKTCPNRPFPGHGFGVLRILGSGGAVPEGTTESTTTTKPGKVNHQAAVTTASVSKNSADTNGASSNGQHGKGHASGHSKGKSAGSAALDD